jgi:hypothetical protein
MKTKQPLINYAAEEKDQVIAKKELKVGDEIHTKV